MEARVPTLGTLKGYGLTLKDWKRILKRQGGVCGVCGLLPPSGILHIEHDHVSGWKKMPPWERKMHVRGLACWGCNSVYLRKGATSERLRDAALFLDRHSRRLARALGI